MTPLIRNIYGDIPSSLPEELFQTVAEGSNVRIERIISEQQSTPSGEWCQQSWDEWVLLLSGSAGLGFEGKVEERKLLPGDYLLIPAGCRHRVDWTDPKEKTIWLAVHFISPAEKEIITA